VFGEFRVDAQQRVLLAADGTRVPLSSRAFELLLFFARHPGELLDKDRLMKAVWPNTVVEENNLNQNIGAIRKALGETPGQPRFLVNEPGRGYRFVAAVTVAGAAPPAAPRRRWPLAAMMAGALVLVAVAVWMSRQRAAPITDRSIAVLPFENRSAARENGYLALGIQDEILTLLTRIGSLRVVPRTEQRLLPGPDMPGPEPADKADQEPAARDGAVSAVIEIGRRLEPGQRHRAAQNFNQYRTGGAFCADPRG